MLKWPYDSPRRGASTRDAPFGEFDGCIGGWQIDGEPYTTRARHALRLVARRMLGGRTNHWGRISLRFGPYDFSRKSRDGLGDDWPIAYDDVTPWYDAIDKLIGIFGSAEGLPNEPDGIFHPPPVPRCYELLAKKARDEARLTCIPSRLSIITKPHNGRAPCHYCGQCNRGCMVKANFSSPDVLIPPALKTGRLTLITNAMAREVTVGKDGLANGVSYIDKKTGPRSACPRAGRRAGGERVRDGAPAAQLEVVAVPERPRELERHGRQVPHRHHRHRRRRLHPEDGGHAPHNEDGVGGMHIYMPWWLDNSKLDFPRGYHIEIVGRARPAGVRVHGRHPPLPGRRRLRRVAQG